MINRTSKDFYINLKSVFGCATHYDAILIYNVNSAQRASKNYFSQEKYNRSKLAIAFRLSCGAPYENEGFYD